MSQLILVRHGQASFGAENYDKLSDIGLEQARCLGKFWAERDTNFDVSLSGDLIRQQETLKGILRQLDSDTPSTLKAELNEYNFEQILRQFIQQNPSEIPEEGASREVFYRLLRLAMHAWANGELDKHAIAESWQEFEDRISTFIQYLQKSFQGKKVLAVSSGGAMSMLVGQVLGLSVEQIIELNLQIQNTSVCEFYFNQSGIKLSRFNHVPHLNNKGSQHLHTYS